MITGLCAGVYSCTVTDFMGDTGSVNITIIDSNFVNTGSISGPASAQQGDTVTYSVNNNTGSYYYWFITGGTLVSSPFSYSVSVVWDSLGQGNIGTYETDSNNCVGDSVLLDVSVGTLTALKETDKGLTYIYPNPFSESTVIEFDNSAGEVFELYVFDMASRLIKHRKGITGNRYEFSRGGISDGIYFLELRSPNKTYLGKLMIE